MNNKKFFESFVFRMFLFDKGRHTDNYKNQGLISNYIVWLKKGSAKFVSKQGTVYLNEGEFLYIPKNCPYHSYWNTDSDSVLQWYSVGFDHIPLSEGGNFVLQKFEADEDAIAEFEKITKNLTVNIENVGRLYLFFGMVLPNMKKDGKPYEASLEKALKYMQENSASKIAEVAQYCNVSEATLYSLFKKRYKKTPNEMRQKILCEKAEELLITTSMSVEEISDRLGFSSSSYFRKILKKHLNTTPTDIRKRSV